MRVVFLVTSFWSYGELLIAKQFAESINQVGHKVLFILPPTHVDSMKASGFSTMRLIPGSANLNRIIFVEVREKFHPDLVILSDFLNYNFADKHYGIRREDLDLFLCKIATFDNFDWKLKRMCMDTYGFVSDIPKRVNIDDYGSRIIPCPIANPTIPVKEGEYRYSVVSNRLIMNPDLKAELLEDYHMNHMKNKKIILVSNAKWQETYADHENIGKFIDLSNGMFQELILRLSIEHFVIIVGDMDIAYENNPNILVKPSMPSEEYDNYIRMSDLYLCRNITSTSMIKVALAGIPCINLMNSIRSTKKIVEKVGSYHSILANDIEDMKAYKYMMYPVGWYEFLSPVFMNNPYGNIIQSSEQFDMEDTLRKIHELLYSTKVKNKILEDIHCLNHTLDGLSSPSDIIKAVIESR